MCVNGKESLSVNFLKIMDFFLLFILVTILYKQKPFLSLSLYANKNFVLIIINSSLNAS